MKLDSRHMSGVSLQGDIAFIELNNVFQFLHQLGVSGELRVVTEHNNGSFEVQARDFPFFAGETDSIVLVGLRCFFFFFLVLNAKTFP
jgi:hypothetical protein